jgi:hypothetical protein
MRATALWSVLKTWGRGSEPRPADLFDRVFNAAAERAGTYRPCYPDNPLFTDDVKTWTFASADRDTLVDRTWLSAALGVADKDLMRIAAVVANGAASLKLDVPTLSALWSVARLARALSTSVADLAAVLRLAGLSRFTSPAEVTAAIDLKEFIAARGLALADLAFIVWGEQGDLPDVVRGRDVAPFLAALRVAAADWLVTPANLSGDDDEARGLSIFDALVYGKALDRGGVVLFPDWKLVFAVMTLLFPLSARQWYVPRLISPDQARGAFEALIVNQVILGDALAAPVNAATVLTFLFPDEKNPAIRNAMIAVVRSVLVDVTQRVELSIAVLKPSLRAQVEGTFSQLASFLGGAAGAAEVAVTAVLAKAFPGRDLRVLLLTPAGDPAALEAPLVRADRIVYLADRLSLGADDLNDAATDPAAFGLTSLDTLSMAAVREWSDYATLVALYPPSPEGPRNIAIYLTTGDTAALSKATGWDAGAFTTLVKALWGKGLKLKPSRLWQVRGCFELAGTLGTDVGSCTVIAQVARLPAMAPGVHPPAWAAYLAAGDDLVAMLKAKSAGGDWAQAYKPVSDREETVRRDGGVPLAVWLSGSPPLNISSTRALSEFLLIDLETSACDVTSAIVEATGAVQTYLQRCRLSLEQGVVSLGDIAPAWWPWLSNYRTWEANRKIFLYPENYLDPNLREDRTELFRKFQEELQQSKISATSVERAFTNYLTGFADLAKLRTVESFRAKAPHPISGTPVETVFFLGRTEAKPYYYYYRALRPRNVWSQWSKIDVATTSPDASLVFAFNRLILFWVEEDTVKGSFIKASRQFNKVFRRANIRYSYRRLDDTWTAPQTLEAEELFDAQPTLYSNNVIDPQPGANSVNGVDPTMPYWRRVSVQAVPGPEEGGERLLITFGNAFPIPADPVVKKPEDTGDTAEELLMVANVYRASQVGASFARKQQGAILMVPAAYLDVGLNVRATTAFLPDFTADPFQPPFAFIKIRTKEGRTNLGPNVSRSVLVDQAFVDSPDYPDRVVVAPFPMLTDVADSARLVCVRQRRRGLPDDTSGGRRPIQSGPGHPGS